MERDLSLRRLPRWDDDADSDARRAGNLTHYSRELPAHPLRQEGVLVEVHSAKLEELGPRGAALLAAPHPLFYKEI